MSRDRESRIKIGKGLGDLSEEVGMPTRYRMQAEPAVRALAPQTGPRGEQGGGVRRGGAGAGRGLSRSG